VGQYILDYSIVGDILESNPKKTIVHDTPSIYATGVSSHYWWGQDEYSECLLSFVIANDISEAKRLGAETKDKLFSMADGDWIDSYSVTALRLEDITKVENH